MHSRADPLRLQTPEVESHAWMVRSPSKNPGRFADVVSKSHLHRSQYIHLKGSLAGFCASGEPQHGTYLNGTQSKHRLQAT